MHLTHFLFRVYCLECPIWVRNDGVPMGPHTVISDCGHPWTVVHLWPVPSLIAVMLALTNINVHIVHSTKTYKNRFLHYTYYITHVIGYFRCFKNERIYVEMVILHFIQHFLLVPDRQTDGHCDTLSSCRSKNFKCRHNRGSLPRKLDPPATYLAPIHQSENIVAWW